MVNFSRETQIDAFMREPADTWRGETWFRIRSGLLRNGAYVHHKSDKGFVDLTFPDTDANLLRELGQHLEPDMSIHQTGNSAAIRLEVPRIESFSDFEVERGKVQQALTALSRLLAFYNRQCTLIEGILYRAHRVKRPLREDAADGN